MEGCEMSNTVPSLARQRIDRLLDENSFVEIGGQITARNTDFNLSGKKTPSDGVVTGYGVIDDNLVYVYSQDASILNGTIGEMHAKKITKLYELAMKTGAPVIGLLDCAGLRLQESTDALNGFGEIYLSQTKASGVIPQITGIFGMCGGGLALFPALTDFTFMEQAKGKLFVNSPNALDGNEISRLDTAGALFQSQETGLIDYLGNENDILLQMRALVCMFPANNEEKVSLEECTDDLNRGCSNMEFHAEDTAGAFFEISDNHLFFEIKKDYAKDVVIGFLRLNGMTVGAVANRSIVRDENGEISESFDAKLSAPGCKKAADFVRLCNAFNIPILTLTNTTGFKADTCTEAHIARAAAQLTYAFANATVPKVNIIIGSAYGSAYLLMNSKSIGADIVYAWPGAEIGMMNAGSAAKIMYYGADAQTLSEKAAAYEQMQSNIISAARRGYVDTIIEPEDTRKYAIGAFEMLFTKWEYRLSKKHGTVK